MFSLSVRQRRTPPPCSSPALTHASLFFWFAFTFTLGLRSAQNAMVRALATSIVSIWFIYCSSHSTCSLSACAICLPWFRLPALPARCLFMPFPMKENEPPVFWRFGRHSHVYFCALFMHATGINARLLALNRYLACWRCASRTSHHPLPETLSSPRLLPVHHRV